MAHSSGLNPNLDSRHLFQLLKRLNLWGRTISCDSEQLEAEKRTWVSRLIRVLSTGEKN